MAKLSHYHQEYAALPDAEIAARAKEKGEELETIFAGARPETGSDPLRIAVLGCGDRRLIAYHKTLFGRILGKAVDLVTFDIVTDHLEGGYNVIQHDCTEPLPKGPFDVTYAHVLLKFIDTERQWDVIRNSYEALKPGGMAIHVLDKGDYASGGRPAPVPLDRWKQKLSEEKIRHCEVPVRYGLAFVLRK